MSATLERRIKVFCPTHKIGYETTAAKTIVCEAGGHLLAQSFPDENFWEYCCDCQTFFPSGVAKENRLSDECVVCESRTARRYLCDACKLISFESDEAARGKAFNVAAGAAVRPSCPGCLAPSKLHPVFHACPEIAADLTTSRQTCPFCQETLEAAPSFPLSVAKFLNQMKAKKTIARLNRFDKSLRAADDGEFVIVSHGARDDMALAVPRLARFESKQQFYEHYKDFYACDDPSAGLVIMQYPAVVIRNDDEWHLKDVGLLRIVGDAATMHAPPLSPEAFTPAPTNLRASGAAGMSGHLVPPPLTSFCPDCGKEAKPHHKFCKKCGKKFDQPPPAAFAPTVPQGTASEFSLPPATQNIGATGNLTGALAASVLNDAAPVTITADARRKYVIIMAVVGVVFLILIGGMISLNTVQRSAGSSSRSTESRLTEAITRGNLIAPAGASAYDYYNQLRSEGASSSVLANYRSRLMPQLTAPGDNLIAALMAVNTAEPPSSDWDDAHRLMAWASEMQPDDRQLAAKAAFLEGRVAYVRDQRDVALRSFIRANELNPTWALPLNNIGWVYNEMEQYETARRYLRRAIERAPNWAIPHNNLGTSYYNVRDHEQATIHYERARQLAPDWARPIAWLGSIAEARRDHCRARDLYQEAIERAQAGMINWNHQRMQENLNRATSECAQQNQFYGY